MGTLVVSTFVSLDGVVQSPGGPSEDTDDGFAHGGWTVPHFDPQLGEFIADTHIRAEAFLFGRRSYQILAGHWPHIGNDDPVAAALNARPKYVISRTIDSAEWHNSTVLSGDAVEQVRALTQRHGGEVLVIGSGNLLQTLTAHSLVDVFHVIVFPVLLGVGKRLFGDTTAPAGLTLQQARTTDTGVVLCTYARAGELAHGSFMLGSDDESGQHARDVR